jgi:hypothetical protein
MNGAKYLPWQFVAVLLLKSAFLHNTVMLIPSAHSSVMILHVTELTPHFHHQFICICEMLFFVQIGGFISVAENVYVIFHGV